MKILFPARSESWKAVLLILVCLSMMVIDHRFQHLQVVRSSISLALSPLRYVVSLPATAGNWVNDWLTAHTELLEENESLRAESQILRARLQKLQVLAEENTRLRNLLSSSRKVADDVIVAELFSVNQSPYRQIIEINKGTADGVQTGMAVIDEHGVMGQVINVNPESATTILISDPDHAIPVQFIRSGLRSVAFGNGSTDVLELRFLPATADIVVGDELVTSGLGGRFPEDYPVGTVAAINEDLVRGFVSVLATPSARLDSSRDVLVIKENPQ